jgi:tripeptide aminopeptidase
MKTEQLVETFCNLVRIDSESGDEAHFINYMAALLEKAFHATCVKDSYGNLIAKISAKNSETKTPILLCAHGDTVMPGKGIDPIVDDGVIRSRGETILGADDKAGIAEIMHALRHAEKHPPIEVVITRNEETGTLGAKALDLTLVSAKTGYVLDGPALDTVIVGGPTHVSIDITIVGKAAHAAMAPEQGISAIQVAAEAIVRMELGRIDDETTANIGTIHGGTIRNGIPKHVEMRAECRSLNHNKCLAQVKAMSEAFVEAGKNVGAEVQIEATTAYQAAHVSTESPVVQEALKAIAAVGLEPKTDVMLGGTDGLVLAGRGIETVVLGIGGRAAHSTDEHIYIVDMLKAADILIHLLHRLA